MIEGLLSLDRSFFLFLNSFHAEWLNQPMNFLSGQVLWIPLFLFSFWISKKNFGRSGFFLFVLFLLLALVASDVTSSYIIKNLFVRMRPCREEELKHLVYFFGQKCGGKFGFVSSHAANSIALVIFTLRTLEFKIKWVYIVWVIPFLVGYSRIYLGVHYPGDILGGFFVGAFWGLLLARFFKQSETKVQA